VASCASGRWGDIPIEPDTEHVDASYAGGASDGSAGAPWTSIQAAVDAARAGAIVAIAAGSYTEDVHVAAKAVRLWGRCPALVEIAGTGAELGALVVTGASNTEVRRLAITGQSRGIAVSDSQDVLVEEMWIHHNASPGVDAEDAFGPTSVVVRSSLLEQNHAVGVLVAGSDATLEAIVVRANLPDAQGQFGRGLNLRNNPATGARASVSVVRSLFEQNHELGVFVGGSDATLDSTVVRESLCDAQGLTGRGLSVQDDPVTGARASVTVARSLFEQNHTSGVYVTASDATLEATVVGATLPNTQGLSGHGVSVQLNQETGARASVTIARSLFEQNHEAGMLVSGSDATLEAIAVRATLPDAQGLAGRGVSAQVDTVTGERANVIVARSLFEQNHEVGVLVSGSDGTLDATLVRATLADTQSLVGRAVQVQDGDETGIAGWVTIRSSLFEQNVDAGIFVSGSASAELDACIVRGTASNPYGVFGDGLVVISFNGPASAAVIATRFEQSARAAISNFGATVALQNSLLACQSFDIGVERWQEQSAVFEDRGGVLCGCPDATGPCKGQSYGLEPPPTL